MMSLSTYKSRFFPPSGKFNLTDFSGKHIFEIKKDATLSSSAELSPDFLHEEKTLTLVQSCLPVVNVHF